MRPRPTMVLLSTALALTAALPAAPRLPAPPAPHPSEAGLSAKDFGALGDGQHDDAPALQAAIRAATSQNQPLLLPAGTYRTNTQLNVPFGTPLRLVGVGWDQSKIVAGATMRAVINVTCLSGPGVAPEGGAATPRPLEGLYIGDVTLDANSTANYSVFAPGLARSRFERVAVDHALRVGISAGYGWCNYFESCRFGRNYIGLHTYSAGNAIEVTDGIFEANYGVGVFVAGGEQAMISGNTLESNGIAIVVTDMMGVTISGNYFEANPDPSIYHTGSPVGVTLLPDHTAAGSATAPPIMARTDILLNGAPFDHAGTSLFADTALDWRYGKAYPTSGVAIRGNTKSGHNTSLVHAICGSGIVLEANVYDGAARHCAVPASCNATLVETGSDASLFGITDLSARGNSGFSAVGADNELVNYGLLHLAPPSDTPDARGPVGVHTYRFDNPRKHRRRNLVASTAAGDADTAQWSFPPERCQVSPAAPPLRDGRGRIRITARASCLATVLALDLDRTPELRAQSLYMLAQVNIIGPSKGHLSADLKMLIDPGSGDWVNSSHTSTEADPKLPGWGVHVFQLSLGVSGVARFGLEVASTTAGPAMVELGAAGVFRVGDDWSALV